MFINAPYTTIYESFHFTDYHSNPTKEPRGYGGTTGTAFHGWGPDRDFNRWLHQQYPYNMQYYQIVFCVDYTYTTNSGCTTLTQVNNWNFENLNTVNIINVHWDESLWTGFGDASTSLEKCRINIPILSVDSGTNLGTPYYIMHINPNSGTGDTIPANATVTLSTGIGRAVDRMNFSWFKYDLSDTGRRPSGSVISINREGWPWENYNYMGNYTSGLVSTNGLVAPKLRESFIELLHRLKAIRPDCLFGLYGVVANGNYDFQCMEQKPHINGKSSYLLPNIDITGSVYYNAIKNYNNYSQTIADASDYLQPYFYYNAMSDVGLSGTDFVKYNKEWVSHVLQTTKRDFPGKRLIPLTWNVNLGELNKRSDLLNLTLVIPPVTGDAWTEDLVEQMMVDSGTWQSFLDSITVNNIKEFAIWGQGGSNPWKL